MRASVVLTGCAAMALAGCASTTLRSYVGRDLSEMERDYGPPSTHVHLPDGSDGFEWVIAWRPGPTTSAPLSAFLPVSAAPIDKRIRASDAGVILGGMCVYTLRARRDAAGGWKVIGYQEPRIDCN